MLPDILEGVYRDLLNRVKLSIGAVVFWRFSGKLPSINFRPKGTLSFVAAKALASRSNLLN